jgi:hypothetical protein
VSKGKGNVVLLIGFKDTGKTTKVKELLTISRKQSFIFDFRNEYGKPFREFDEWASEAATKRNYNIVIEEATVVLPRRGENKDIRNLCAGSSHHSNTIYILYHSLRSIPDYIFDLTNYYYLFHTSDNEGTVRSLYRYEPEIIEDYLIVKKSTNKHFYTVRKRL